MNTAIEVKDAFARLADGEKETAFKGIITGMSPKEQKKALATTKSVVDNISVVPEKTRHTLWLIVICGFVIVLVGSFAILAGSLFFEPPEGATSSQLMLTVFTTVVGFLAGLFSPSPVDRTSGGTE